MFDKGIKIDILGDIAASSGIRPIKITRAENDHDKLVAFLRSCCEDSGSEYASFWSICGGRLCIISAWAKYAGGRSFVSDSSGFMLEPGVGAIGRAFKEQQGEFIEDVRRLPLEMFARREAARNHDIRGLLVVPWSGCGVLELGAQGTWQVPPNFIRSILQKASPSTALGNIPSGAVWEAVLWKRSRFFRCWRRRLFRLIDVGDGWQLSSCDVLNARITGAWKLDRCLPYIQIAPKYGFLATMQLSDVVLSTDSRVGADAMEELATVLNGSLMRQGQPKTISSRNVHRPCPLVKAHSIVDASNSRRDECVLKFGIPQCENCGLEVAQGRLVVQPISSDEIGRWLCKCCFVSTWLATCEGETDGRLGGWPQWFLLTLAGDLKNSTPPRTQRYSNVR